MRPYTFGYQRPGEAHFCRMFDQYHPCVLEHNTDYCAVVKASSHGHASWRFRAANAIRACFVPPVVGFVVETARGAGATEDVDFTRTGVLTLRWGGFYDDCAGMARYEVSVYRWLPLARSWEPILWRHTDSVTKAWDVVLDMPGFHRVVVCGITAAGLQSCARSDGVHYDVTPPAGGRVIECHV